MAALWPDTIVEEANLAFQISALRNAGGRRQRRLADPDGADEGLPVCRISHHFGIGIGVCTREPSPSGRSSGRCCLPQRLRAAMACSGRRSRSGPLRDPDAARDDPRLHAVDGEPCRSSRGLRKPCHPMGNTSPIATCIVIHVEVIGVVTLRPSRTRGGWRFSAGTTTRQEFARWTARPDGAHDMECVTGGRRPTANRARVAGRCCVACA